ncbi:MAG: lysostaphin resistance A-like protein [Pseudonocardia sp.]
MVEAIFLVVSALVGAAVLGDGTPSVGGIAAALLVPTVVAAGTALLVTWLRGNGPRVDLGLTWSWRDVGLGLGFGFGGLALTAIAGVVYVWILGPDASSAVGDIFDGRRSGLLAALLIGVIVVVIAPICEEIIYRGLLWGALEKLRVGPWIAFGVTTVVFALAHFELTRAPLLLVISIPIGLARLVTGRLLASIVAHQVNNLLPGVALVLGLLGVLPI